MLMAIGAIALVRLKSLSLDESESSSSPSANTHRGIQVLRRDPAVIASPSPNPALLQVGLPHALGVDELSPKSNPHSHGLHLEIPHGRARSAASSAASSTSPSLALRSLGSSAANPAEVVKFRQDLFASSVTHLVSSSSWMLHQLPNFKS